MLHARLYEIDGPAAGLDRAFQYLRQAAEQVVPGSDNDLLIRLHSANWLALRYDEEKDPADLDQAVNDYTELAGLYPPDSVDALLVSANLGRCLINRSRLTGSAEDRRGGVGLLDRAAGHLPPDHPALAHIQRMLLAARHAPD
jgi:hypothetical protein